MNATPQEQWLPVVGYEGSYEVSDQGRVRSLDRYRRKGPWNASIIVRGKLMKLSTKATGYQSVILAAFGKADHLVHRLVLEAFVGPCPSGSEGCHGNGDRADNRLVNLRWDTRSENNLDQVVHGTHRNARKTHCKRGHEFTPENTRPGSNGLGRRCRKCEPIMRTNLLKKRSLDDLQRQ